MAIHFNCVHCGRRYEVTDDWAGKRVKCKACERVLTVPSPKPAGFNINDLAGLADGRAAEPHAPQPHSAIPPYAQSPIPLRSHAPQKSNKWAFVIVLILSVVFITLGVVIMLRFPDADWAEARDPAVRKDAPREKPSPAPQNVNLEIDRTIPPGAKPYPMSLVQLLADGPGEDHDLIELRDFQIVPATLMTIATRAGRIQCAWVILRPTDESLASATQSQRIKIGFSHTPGVVLRMDGFTSLDQIKTFFDSPRVIGSIAGQGDALFDDAGKYRELVFDLNELAWDNVWVIDLNKMPLPGVKPWWPSEQTRVQAKHEAERKAQADRTRAKLEAMNAERRKAIADRQAAEDAADKARREAARLAMEDAAQKRQAELDRQAAAEQAARDAQMLREQAQRDKENQEYRARLARGYIPPDLTGLPLWKPRPDDRLGQPICVSDVSAQSPADFELTELSPQRIIWRRTDDRSPAYIAVVQSFVMGVDSWPPIPADPGGTQTRGNMEGRPFTRVLTHRNIDGRSWIMLRYVGRDEHNLYTWQSEFPDEPGRIEQMDSAAATMHYLTKDERRKNFMPMIKLRDLAESNRTAAQPDPATVGQWSSDPDQSALLGDYVKVCRGYEIRPPRVFKQQSNDADRASFNGPGRLRARLDVERRSRNTAALARRFPLVEAVSRNPPQFGRLNDLLCQAVFETDGPTLDHTWTGKLHAYHDKDWITVEVSSEDPNLVAALRASVMTLRPIKAE